jgi:hypothetical protein
MTTDTDADFGKSKIRQILPETIGQKIAMSPRAGINSRN